MEPGEARSDRSLGNGVPDAAEPDGAASSPRPMSAEEIESIRDAIVGADPETRRFSLWGLLAVVTGASLMLALGSYLPKPVFAGGLGIATLVTMVALSRMRHPPAVLQVAWWTLLLIYLMAIGAAILG